MWPTRNLLAFGLAMAMVFLCTVGCGPDAAVDYTQVSDARSGPVQGIVARWVSPEPTEPQAARVEVVVEAMTEGRARPLHAELVVASGWSTPMRGEPADDGMTRFSAPVALLHGRNTVEVRLREVEGARGRTVTASLQHRGSTPALRALGLRTGTGCTGARLPGWVSASTRVCLEMEASALEGTLATFQVVQEGGASVDAVRLPDGRWAADLALPEEQESVWEVVLTDDSGATGRTPLRLTHDPALPPLSLSSPAEGAVVLPAVLRVEGEAGTDDRLPAELRLRVDGRLVHAWTPTSKAWSRDVVLGVGAHVLRVEAVDASGAVAFVERRVERARTLALRRPLNEPQTAVLQLDRFAVESLLSPEEQRRIDLLDVRPEPFIAAALGAIRDPGAFGVDTSSWTQAEWNMHRLLTMTADTADLTGTSLEELAELSLGLGLPSPRMLSELLDMGVTQPALSLELGAEVLTELLYGSHPNAVHDENGRPVFRITLEDALTDLATFVERFRAVGDHPGLFSGEVRASLLEPGFALILRASSRLQMRDCVDANLRRKDYRLVPPSSGPPVTVDFLDPRAFTVVGLVDEPTVDLGMRLSSGPVFVPAGLEREARPVDGRPGFYRGDGDLFEMSPWLIERLLAESLFRQLVDQHADNGWQAERVYRIGSIEEAAVKTWDRGWVVIRTAGGLGSPPPPVYVWQAFTEVAQIRLRDGLPPEGEVELAFELRDVPVGLEARDLLEALRPQLQAQEELLVSLLVGDSGLFDGQCDVAVVASGGDLLLEYVAPVQEGARPGLFLDEALRTPAGSPTDDHPLGAAGRALPQAGVPLYFQSAQGERMRLEIVKAGSDEVEVTVWSAEERP